MGVKETEVFLLPVRSFSPSSPNGTVERRGAAAAANTRMVDVTDKPQIVEHVNKSLSMTVYETKWIPSSARFVLLGSPARQTGMLQIYQLNGGSIELEAEVERPKSFKCGTFGATTLAERRIATGDFVGTLAIWDLERLKVRPNLALALALTPALALAPAPAPASGQALALALTLTRRRWSSRRTTRSSTVSAGAVGSRVPCS